MFCIPHDGTGTSVRALSPGCQLHVIAISFAYSHMYTCAKTHAHLDTAGSDPDMYGFDPDPTHLNAAQSDTAKRFFLVIYKGV